ncbi:MAG: VWA domain-containing protein [Pseudomonadota bacterium]
MTPWARAITALRLLQEDPDGLGGALIEARAGPVRDALIARLPSSVRLHPAMAEDALNGGLDVAQSMIAGDMVRTGGLLDTTQTLFVLPMAERTAPQMAHHLATCLDRQQGNHLIALDEHAEDEAPPPLSLTDRLAFHVSLNGVALAETEADVDVLEPVAPETEPVEAPVETLVHLAVRLGVRSLRAPYQALRAAQAHAQLRDRDLITPVDIAVAAGLVLAPRATLLPNDEAPQAPETPPKTPPDPDTGPLTGIPDEILLSAIETALPPDLLRQRSQGLARQSAGRGAGHKRIGNRQGRPLPAREGRPRGDKARISLMATLRAAVPWQKLRKKGQTHDKRPVIRPSDLRYQRYETLSDRLLIFAVDASGSSAIARLAEAKGAIEHLLAEAYAKRDYVTLIAFRGDRAEVLLPPTRSLVQTKRRLSDLPGGGATPLAAGLQAAFEAAETAKAKGMRPHILLLTDGRGNIALDGTADRTQAAADSAAWSTQIARAGHDCTVIDTSRRPDTTLKDMAASLRGHYVSLPRVDARRLSQTISSTLDD